MKYAQLVAKRRACLACMDARFGKGETLYRNQHGFVGITDEDHIGNFSKWAHDLNAEVLIVGQDYCDVTTYIRDDGKIQLKPIPNDAGPEAYSTETNYRLRQLVAELGHDLGSPSMGTSNSGVFLTNAVLCMKPGGMSDSNPETVYRNCSTGFLRPLIELVHPKAVIALGLQATRSVLFAYLQEHPEFKVLRSRPFGELFTQRRIELDATVSLFPVYHPGALGRMNRQRVATVGEQGWALQLADWKRIGGALRA